MPAEILCPACGHRLEIPVVEQYFPLTCPRCLARLDTALPATATRHGTRPQRVPDVEIGSDTKRTGVGLIVLAVLGGVGIAYHLLIAGTFAASGDIALLVIVLVVVAFLALLSTGIVLWRTRENPAARGVGRVIFGTLALAGALIAACFVLSLALVVFLFAVCLSGKSLFGL
jgi:hypothetical protein